MSKKHPQSILAMDSSYFINDRWASSFRFMPTLQFMQQAQSHLVIREREALEMDPTYRQLLPYIVLFKTLENGQRQYFCYRRTKAVGESRLAGNVSIGYGGHIDLADICVDAEQNGNSSSSVISLMDTICHSAARELNEEVRLIDIQTGGQNQVTYKEIMIDGYIVETDLLTTKEDGTLVVPVGNVHVGLVVLQEIPAEWRVDIGEDELAYMEPMTSAELLASELPLENWTRIILTFEEAFFNNRAQMLKLNTPEEFFAPEGDEGTEEVQV